MASERLMPGTISVNLFVDLLPPMALNSGSWKSVMQQRKTGISLFRFFPPIGGSWLASAVH